MMLDPLEVVICPLIFGTSDPNISSEDFLEKVETNFRVNNNSSSIESPEDIINGIDSVLQYGWCFLLSPYWSG